jgi:hypothetical protein
MTKSFASKRGTTQSSRELTSLQLSFAKVRILHYAAAEPVSGSAMLLRLRAHNRALTSSSVDRLLASMARNGWLKLQTVPAYSLTRKGHGALKTAKRHLTQLVRKR